MGSEADTETTAANAVDSDGSVSWEDFFGTTTDLVPQLLGMFDELARRGNGYTDHVVLPSACNIPAALQKRLSLVSHRGSIFGQFHPELSKSQSDDAMAEQPTPEDTVDVIVSDDVTPTSTTASQSYFTLYAVIGITNHS